MIHFRQLFALFATVYAFAFFTTHASAQTEARRRTLTFSYSAGGIGRQNDSLFNDAHGVPELVGERGSSYSFAGGCPAVPFDISDVCTRRDMLTMPMCELHVLAGEAALEAAADSGTGEFSLGRRQVYIFPEDDGPLRGAITTYPILDRSARGRRVIGEVFCLVLEARALSLQEVNAALGGYLILR